MKKKPTTELKPADLINPAQRRTLTSAFDRIHEILHTVECTAIVDDPDVQAQIDKEKEKMLMGAMVGMRRLRLLLNIPYGTEKNAA